MALPLPPQHPTRYLTIACEVAGLPFGDRAGLHIRFPNA